MNWIKKLFSRKSASSVSERSGILSVLPETITLHQASQAQKILQQNLTIEQLKKFIPLRDLDDSSLAAIHHASLIYKKGATIFSLGQPTENIFYLLDGHIQMQPDGACRYEIDSSASLYILPLNSGKHLSASA